MFAKCWLFYFSIALHLQKIFKKSLIVTIRSQSFGFLHKFTEILDNN